MMYLPANVLLNVTLFTGNSQMHRVIVAMGFLELTNLKDILLYTYFKITAERVQIQPDIKGLGRFQPAFAASSLVGLNCVADERRSHLNKVR